MRRFLFLFLCIFHAFADELPTVSYVDLERYLGTWYEIARFEHRFEKGCSDVKAIYAKRDEGMISVTNSCYLADEKRLKEAFGRAYVADEKSNAKLKVTFFWPFYGNYWIIDLAEDYRYAVVSEPSKEYFWILSRSEQMDAKDKEHILSLARHLGFDTSKLIWRSPN